jgi:glycosyltransferase involved in cell wall biosynthesis
VSDGARVPITVVIPTLDESERIAAAIDSVRWAREIIVADGGSSDETVSIARTHGATVLEGTGPTIGAQRNAAIEHATSPWILALDADERATTTLRDQLSQTLPSTPHDAFHVRRRNTYLGRVMAHGAFGRDWHLCVFRRSLRYSAARVHERVQGVQNAGRLEGPLEHEPYRDLSHHAAKMERYAAWGAADRYARGVRSSAAQLLVKPPLRFVRDYVAYAGCLDGWQGAVAAMMSAHSVFLRLAMLREMENDE